MPTLLDPRVTCVRAGSGDGCKKRTSRLSLMRHLWQEVARTRRSGRMAGVPEVFQRKMGLPPLPETTELYQRIRAGAAQAGNPERHV